LKNIFNDSFHTYKYCHNKNTQFNNLKSIDAHIFRSIEEGKIVVEYQEKTITAQKGDLLYMPFGKYANIKIFAEPYCLGTIMRLVYMPEVDILGYPPQVIKMNDEFKKTFDDIPMLNPFEENVTSNIIWKTYRFLELFQKDVVKYTDEQSLKIQKALSYMKKNDNYTIKELAEYCKMSEKRFESAFNKILGTSPLQVKQRIQAVKADTLLKTTDLSVEEIANVVGFYSTNQLRNVMKKRYDLLPKDIRKIK